MKILHVSANPKPTNEANSKQLTEEFFHVLEEHGNDIDITHIDLYDSPPPYYSYSTYKYFWYPVFIPDYKQSEEEKEAAGYANEQIKLFNNADVLVITTPMWNFSIPAILKAWEDMVLAPNGVFTLGPDGVKPLHHIRKIIVLLSSGGAYSGERAASDALTPQIIAAFGFIGISDIEFARADGQNPFFFKDMEERKQKGLEEARELAKKVVSMKKEAVK